MKRKLSPFVKFVAATTPGFLAIALITLISFRAHLTPAIPMLLFLLVVVVQSLRGGFASAAVVSILAVGCVEYFFIPPVLEWQIADPENGVALVTYLATSLVITRLASKAQSEARNAERRGRDVTLLYDASSRLLSLDPEMAAGPDSLRMFCEVFGLRAACFFDAASDKLYLHGKSVNGLVEKTREACFERRDFQDREHGLYIRSLRTGGDATGAVGIEGQIEDESIALALTALAATALERTRSFRIASTAAADAQAEILRTAILDAFAHEFKTPLAIILAASGGLRETISPQAEQVELMDIIDNQAVRLSQLTTRLVRMARLDRSDVKPQLEPTSLHPFLGRLMDQCRSQFGRDITMKLPLDDAKIMADPELLGLAITQLVDNACKYSQPGSLVELELDVNDHFSDLRVRNEGHPIRRDEEERIFDRFFRGAETEHITPGAGLGLYVARKIIRAHGGVLDLDRNQLPAMTTTFQIRLPIVQHEREPQPTAG